jgi:hypothetical protein
MEETVKIGGIEDVVLERIRSCQIFKLFCPGWEGARLAERSFPGESITNRDPENLLTVDSIVYGDNSEVSTETVLDWLLVHKVVMYARFTVERNRYCGSRAGCARQDTRHMPWLQ